MDLETTSLQDRRARSALLFVVPEVAPLIDGYRRAYTADGASVPAHITLHHPFFGPGEITDDVRLRIAGVAAAVPAFEFTVSRLAHFPTGLMYLAPEPIEPFHDLVARLRQEFHELSPYWDQYDEVVPHITVADPAVGNPPMDDIAATLAEPLPIRCDARKVVLLQRIRPAPAPWDIQGRFPLNGNAS